MLRRYFCTDLHREKDYVVYENIFSSLSRQYLDSTKFLLNGLLNAVSILQKDISLLR